MCSFCNYIFGQFNIYKDPSPEDIGELEKRQARCELNYIFHDGDDFSIFADSGDPFMGAYVEKIKYCPYCGRDLKEG